MIEEQTIALRWVPTWKQIADPMTKEMSGTLLDSFRNHPFLSLVQTEDRVEEQRRSDLRRGQRERRKVRMKSGARSTSFSPDVKHVCILTCTIILSFHVISPLRRPIKQASMSLAFAKSPIAYACLLCITLIPLLKEPWFFGLLILQVLLEVWLTSHSN